MTALYHSQKVVLPVGFRIVQKQSITLQALRNRIRFRYVLTDVRSASARNMMFIGHDMKKSSVMPVKADRDIALSDADRRQSRYVRADEEMSGTDTPIKIFPEEADFPMLLIRQVSADRDGSEGIPYLVTDGTALTYGQITTCFSGYLLILKDILYSGVGLKYDKLLPRKIPESLHNSPEIHFRGIGYFIDSESFIQI